MTISVMMKSIPISELREQLLIDKHALDDELIRQSQLFSEIGDQAVMAGAERDAAKENLEVTDSRLDTEWRKKLSTVKTTEKIINNHVKTDPRHEKAFELWLEAKSKADELENLQKSFLQRANMLKSLCQLYTSNYWMDSSIKPSKATEASHYAANRSRISNARAARGK